MPHRSWDHEKVNQQEIEPPNLSYRDYGIKLANTKSNDV